MHAKWKSVSFILDPNSQEVTSQNDVAAAHVTFYAKLYK